MSVMHGPEVTTIAGLWFLTEPSSWKETDHQTSLYQWWMRHQMTPEKWKKVLLNWRRSCIYKMNVSWLIDWLFTVLHPSQEYFTYMETSPAVEGLQNLGLCLALRTFEQRGIFIVPHLLWHGVSVFPVSSEGLAFYETLGDVEDLFYSGSSQVPYQSPFTTHKGVWRTYSNRDGLNTDYEFFSSSDLELP